MTTSYKYNRLSKEDAVVLLLEHQSGLILGSGFKEIEIKD